MEDFDDLRPLEYFAQFQTRPSASDFAKFLRRNFAVFRSSYRFSEVPTEVPKTPQKIALGQESEAFGVESEAL